MAEFARAHGIRLRPHAKMHKSAAIAKAQIAAGAVGVCAQKVSEAEVLADAGISNIFISNEVIDAAKLARVAALAARITLAIAVDSTIGVDRLAEACTNAGSALECVRRDRRGPGALRGVACGQRVRSRATLSRAACASRGCRRTRAEPSTFAAPPIARPQRAARRLSCAPRRRASPPPASSARSSPAEAPARLRSTSRAACTASFRWAVICSWTASMAASIRRSTRRDSSTRCSSSRR